MVINNSAPRIATEAGPKFDSVLVSVPARLHLGFLDLNGDLGRRYGSLGVTIEGIRTRLRIRPSDALSGRGPSSEHAVGYVKQIARALGLDDRLEVTVEEAIPEHAGLGSGTQLALAAGAGVAALHGLDLQPREIARLLGRGRRSGIGIGAFEGGGVLLDGGSGPGADTPPLLCRYDFPAAWRIVLVFDRRRQGKHGVDEEKTFHDLPPLPGDVSARICRLVLMVALPALVAPDIDEFGRAVGEIQRALGDHFAPAQDGRRFASDTVGDVLSWFEGQGVTGVGQSSWGPTGFALIGGEDEAGRLTRAASERCVGTEHLEFMICKGRNTGNEIEDAGWAGGKSRP